MKYTENEPMIAYKEFESANILGVKLEHNGCQGGDAGHGGYVHVTFSNEGSTCMEVNDEQIEDKFTITFRGDCERQTFIDACKFIVYELENNGNQYNPKPKEIGKHTPGKRLTMDDFAKRLTPLK